MTAAAAKAEIGHNSASVGEMLAENPEVLFREKDMLPALIESIEKEIADHKPDLKTEKGRKAIASLAYSIAKRKTSLDESGKALNAKMRKELDVVDEVRRKLRDSLDGLRDKARAPLDAWEKEEEDRKEVVTSTRQLFATATHIPADMTIEAVDETLALLDRVSINPAVFGELTEPAEKERAVARLALKAARARIERAEADRVELERLRAEKEETERKAREAAAAEAARKADEERIAAAAKAAAEKAAADERRKAQEVADAAAAAQAKADAAREAAAAAERRKAQDAIDEANRKQAAAEAALEAERRAEAAKVAAAEKAKAEQARLDAERQRNQEHRQKLMKAAKEAIMEHGGIKEDAARLIVLAIVAGSVPNVTLEF